MRLNASQLAQLKGTFVTKPEDAIMGRLDRIEEKLQPLRAVPAVSLRQQAAMQGAFLEESVIEQVAKLEVAIRALKIPNVDPLLERLAAIENKIVVTPEIDLAPVVARLADIEELVSKPSPAPPSLEPVIARLGKVETAITSGIKGRAHDYVFDIVRNDSGEISEVTAKALPKH